MFINVSSIKWYTGISIYTIGTCKWQCLPKDLGYTGWYGGIKGS